MADGARVTVLPGTAVGVLNYRAGFLLGGGASFVSEGTPTKPITYTSVKYAQEPSSGGHWYWDDHVPWGITTFAAGCGGGDPPSLDFRFCNFYLPPEDSHFWSGVDASLGANGCVTTDPVAYWTLRDCSINGGMITVGLPTDPSNWLGAGAITWFNNTFDRVTINLDPSGYQMNWPASLDLSFQAYNNTFHTGTLRVESFPNSDGSTWVFKDNLFDKIAFEQDAIDGVTLPLSHDYNAYWECTQSELHQYFATYGWDSDGSQYGVFPMQEARLKINDPSVDGLHDQIMLYAVPYVPGPYGDFYVDRNWSWIYGVGSRTPADAGLYHFTTRFDQVKEGEEPSGHMVNIGRHYVATSNGADLQPRDTDGDGIPDFVENRAGDGQAGNPGETSWLTATSDGQTPDALSTVYDDIDLDGDGMVGRIERALNSAAELPLVPDNSLALTQLASGSDPNLARFEVAVSYDTVTPIGKLLVLIDSEAAEMQAFERAADGNCVIVWNTTFDNPGLHWCQAELVLSGQPAGIPDSATLVAIGPVGLFTNKTVMTFEPFYSEYHDTGGTLFASLPESSATYEIDLMDPSDLTGNPVKTMTGSTGNGTIAALWDLSDDRTGAPYAGQSVQARFSVTLQSGASGVSSQWVYRDHDGQVIDDWNFTIAYAWDVDSQATGVTRDCIQHGVVDTLVSPYTDGGGGSAHPYGSTFNQFSYAPAGQPGVPGYIADITKVTPLINDLALYFTKNFHFDGHGERDVLNDGPRGLVTIARSAVEGALGNHSNPYDNITRGHPYRLVFLNACHTADDPGWRSAFGVYNMLSADEVQSWPAAVQAFVGWRGESSAPVYDQDWQDMQLTYSVFYGAWMAGLPLAECVHLASSHNPDAPFDSYTLKFPLGKKYSALYESVHPGCNDFFLRICGYQWITREGYVLPP